MAGRRTSPRGRRLTSQAQYCCLATPPGRSRKLGPPSYPRRTCPLPKHFLHLMPPYHRCQRRHQSSVKRLGPRKLAPPFSPYPPGFIRAMGSFSAALPRRAEPANLRETVGVRPAEVQFNLCGITPARERRRLPRQISSVTIAAPCILPLPSTPPAWLSLPRAISRVCGSRTEAASRALPPDRLLGLRTRNLYLERKRCLTSISVEEVVAEIRAILG